MTRNLVAWSSAITPTESQSHAAGCVRCTIGGTGVVIGETAIIEDDVYGELYFDTERPRPAKAFDRQGLVMHCSSFSKTLAPGYRIGWAVPGRYLREVAQAKLTTTLTSPVPTQLALASYLEKGAYDQHLRRLRTQLKNQYGQFSKALGRHFPAGTRATRPDRTPRSIVCASC